MKRTWLFMAFVWISCGPVHTNRSDRPQPAMVYPGLRTHVVLATSSERNLTVLATGQGPSAVDPGLRAPGQGTSPTNGGALIVLIECYYGPDSFKVLLDGGSNEAPSFRRLPTSATQQAFRYEAPARGARLTIRLANLHHAVNACTVIPYALDNDLASLRRPGAIEAEEWRQGTLLEAAGLTDQTWELALPAPATLTVESRTSAHDKGLELRLQTRTGEVLGRSRGSLELDHIPPGTHELVVDGAASPYLQHYEVQFSYQVAFHGGWDKCVVRSLDGGWARFDLNWEQECDRAARATVRIHERTRLTLNIRADDHEQVYRRYLAPGGEWQEIGPRFVVDPVTRFGLHKVEVGLKGRPESGETVKIGIGASFPRICTEVRGQVVRIFRTGELLVEVGRDDFVKKGDQGRLRNGKDFVGNIEMLSPGPKLSLVKVIRARVDVKPGIEAVFEYCRTKAY